MAELLGRFEAGEVVVEVSTPSPVFSPGDTVPVETCVQGTDATTIDEVDLTLESYYRTEDGHREITLERHRLADEISIESGLTEVRETDVRIPYETPVTLGSVDAWMTVEFTRSGTTETERKYLSVTFPDRSQAVFDSMIDLGYEFRGAECLATRSLDERALVERLEFAPSNAPSGTSVETVDLTFRIDPDALTLGLAVDRDDSRTFRHGNWADTTIDATDRDRIRQRLASLVEEHVSPEHLP